MKILIKQDTPFHQKGTKLAIKTFKDIYPAFKYADFTNGGNKIFNTGIKTANPEGSTFNYDYWFEVVEELTFGGYSVDLIKDNEGTTEEEIIIKCQAVYFRLKDLINWYYHFTCVMQGFKNIDYCTHNTDATHFKGFTLKRHMMPEVCFLGISNRNTVKPLMSEKGHLTNTVEYNQTMTDDLYFPLTLHNELKDIGITVGCTTGTLQELVNIINEAKKL